MRIQDCAATVTPSYLGSQETDHNLNSEQNMPVESPSYFHSSFPPLHASEGPTIEISSPEPGAQTLVKRSLDRMRRNSPAEIKSEKPYWLLEGTGFDVRGQVDKLLRDLALGVVKGQNRKEIISGWVGQTSQDIIGYDLEYLKGETVFPILLGIKDVGGRKRVVGTKYNDQPWLDTVLPQERSGAVKDTVAAMEQFLIRAQEGDAAIMVSPPEWSGLTTRNGEPIVFPDTQIYIVQKLQGENINAMTLRLDMTVEQCERLLNKLGIELPQGLDRHQQIEGIVRSTIFKRVSEGRFSADGLIDTLEEVKGGKGAYKGKTFDDMRRNSKRLEELLRMEGKVKEIIDEFTEFSLSNLDDVSDEKREALEKVLGETLLKLTIFEKKITLPSLNVGTGSLPNGFAPMEMMMALKTMQSIGGCAGGGSVTSVGSAGAFRVGIVPGSGEAFFECPGCHKGIPAGEGRTMCPHCFLSKDNYQKQSGVACD